MKVIWNMTRLLLIVLFVVVLLFPIALLLVYSITEPSQLQLIVDATHHIHSEYNLFKLKFDFSALLQTGTESRKFSIAFLNSVQYSIFITFGQLALAFPAAIALSVLKVKGRYFVIPLYMIVMMMPFQVTMVPSYLTLYSLGMLDSALAIIIPLWFMPFSAVMLYLFMIQIPHELHEAAQVDGAGTLQLVRHIVFPLTKHGLLSIGLLCFIDSWNMIEQPLVFLHSIELMPLSIMIRQSLEQSAIDMFAPAALFLIPIVILYSMFYRYIIYGLRISLAGTANKDL